MGSSWTIDPISIPQVFGDMILNDNGTATVVTDASKVVAIEGWAADHLNLFTVVASKNGVITGTANNSSGILRITDAAHGLATGDIVTINGLATAAQNAVTVITKIDDNTFDCDDITYVTAAETGTWDMGSYLLVPVGGTGTYMVMFHASATAAGTGKTFLVQLYINTASQDDLKTERKYAASDIGAIGFMGIPPLVAGDRVWLAIVNLTDGTDITLKHGNLAIYRL